MLILPIESPDHQDDHLIVILNEHSLERMQAADPAEIKLRETGKRLVNPTITLCFEKSSPELAKLLHSGNLPRIIAFLRRGWKFRPELGDHDHGPRSLKDLN